MDLHALLGASPGPFVGLTIVLFGGIALLTGEAIARTWKPAWLVLPYGLMLGAADRFLHYALFDGRLLSPYGYLLHSAILIALAYFAFRVVRAAKMVSQYPWLYERQGLFGWRSKSAEEPPR